MRPVAAALAFGAADEDIAEELHFNFLKTRAAAAFALALRGVEAEGAGVEPALAGEVGLGEKFADFVKRAGIDGRIGAGRFAEDGLVHQHGRAEDLPAAEGGRSEGRGSRVEG